MRVSFLTVGSVVSAVFLVVACGTRNSRPGSNLAGGSLAPQGKFTPDTKVKPSDDCAPVSDGIDKDLKVGDKVEGSLSVKTAKGAVNFVVTEEITEISNSATRSKGVFKSNDGKEIKINRSCEATGGQKWTCKNDPESPIENLQNSNCTVKNDKAEKTETTAGSFKMANGQTLKVNKRLVIVKGPIECKDGDKVETIGNGTSVHESYTSSEIVALPGNGSSCQEAVFQVARITTDDGKEVYSLKMERTQSPLRKK